MLEAAGALQSANGGLSERGLRATAAVSWHALLAAALLALALGAALYEGLSGGRSSVAPAARLHAATQLHPGAASHKKGLGLSSLPLAAQGPISQALGADSPAYRVSASRTGFAAASPAQRLALRFDRSGVSINSGASHVGLSLRAAGYGSTLSVLGAVAPRVSSNQVFYDRASLSEWYVNGPVGLEQGFTIARAPSGHAAGPLTLSLALSGNGRSSLGPGGKSVTLGQVRGSALRYSGLSAADARGRVLRSWLELQNGRLLVRVDARGARYPLRIDPFVQQGEKLTATGEKGEEGQLGFSVALSPEGNTALIGGPRDSAGLGAAWVFTRTGEKWTQQGAKLTGKEEAGAGEFGKSVALSSEVGTTYALIGGAGDNEHLGTAWVFTRSGTTWTQQGPKLTAKSGEESAAGEFGQSVALSSTGEYALVGAPGDAARVGAAFVFLRTGTTWAQQGPKLIAKSPEETGAGEFGQSVALASAKGDYALIGAPGDNTNVGAAWVFLRTSTTWAQQGTKLAAKSPEETGMGEFGQSVALSSEGTTALMGAPGDKTFSGAAWVFTRSGTAWAQQGEKLTAKSPEEIGEGLFGAGVALSPNGATALIGAPGDNAKVGAAWVFLRTAEKWAQQGAKLTAKSGEEIGAGEFGGAVALASEGNTALIGAHFDRGGVGAGWVFTRSGTIWTQQGAKLTGSGAVREGEQTGKGGFGYSVALSPDGNTALIGGYLDNKKAGAAWVFTRSGEKWTQQGAKLIGTGESGAGEFGKSVALSAEVESKTYALIGGPADNTKVGAAWVFTRSGTTWTQQGAKLIAKSPEETGAGEFGKSVALGSAKGEYALIGAPADNTNVGAAWVFLRTGPTWAQQGAKLVAKSPEETGAGEFGKSVALSPDGAYALTGAPADNTNVGAAWVFLRTGTTWAQQGTKLVGTGETGAGSFGSSVALSAEVESKTYALIGGPADNTKVGAAWSFLRTGTAWAAGAKLTGTGETGAGEFGLSVALSSAKGEYALIGGPADNAKLGAAFVFLRSGTTFTQQGGKLTGTGESGAGEFGFSVALSAEGSPEGKDALMGGWKDNKEVGAAWAFTRSGTTWTQQGEKLLGAGEIGEGAPCLCGKGLFGYSVALSADGNTALIGGQATVGVGAAWVFTRSGTTWTQQGTSLSAKSGEESAAGEFGKSVALSGEGNTALIGAPNESSGVGAAWVFTRSGATWTQQGGKLTGSGESGAAEFGTGVALSSDGNTALIGGPKDGPFPVGAAWVFTRSSEKWTQQGEKLGVGGLSVEAFFAKSVALSSDGNTALIDAPGQNKEAGAAWVFIRSESKWSQQSGELTGSGETGAGSFGASGALSSDGNTALIGGPHDNINLGAAWVFTRSGSTWAVQGGKLTGSGETGEGELGQSAALSSEGNTALIGGPSDNESAGAAWVFTRSGAAWTQQGAKLTGSGASGAASFGFSVALSAEGNSALMGGYTDNSNVGAAWVFVNTAPTVVTKAASSVTQTTATLNATVNPDGGTVSDCKFEYGTTEAYGSTASCASLPGSGTSPVAVSAAVTALVANTAYHFRISATNAGGLSKGQDETFKTPQSTPTVVTGKASAITQTTATLNATVNPNGTEVSDCKFEYGTTTEYTSTPVACASLPGSGTSPIAVSAAVTGLAANTTYHFRISATNAGGTSKGADETFKTLPNAPTVETKAASPVAQTTATLNATVNPNGGEVTDCKFEYGTTTEYTSTPVACASLPGSGTSPIAVSAAVTGLAANTTYHFRISSTNAGGTSKGSDETFKTLPNAPTVVTEKASAVTQTTATLNATVNPNGGAVTDCKFEYGTNTEYKSTPVSCASLPGSGTSPVAVSASLVGLTANTTYHFRISAANASGTSKGSDETFKTVPSAPTVLTKPASAITQTSATLNATVNPNGGEVSECKFEVGETEVYTFIVACSSLPGSGTSPVAVTGVLGPLSLNENTTYHFRIVATNPGGTSKGADETFKTLPNPPAVVTKAASAITPTSAKLNATVNPNGGEVTDCKFEYGTTTEYKSTPVSCASPPGSGTSAVAVSAPVTGLAANTTYHFRISATNAGGTNKGSDATFKTPPNAPTVVTKPATAVTQTAATLNATVNPNAGEVTDCKFEVGETETYTFTVACSSLPGSGESPVAVSAALTGLAVNTTYHFRIVATNTGGTSKGSDETVKTLPNPPAVVTKAASAVTQTTAALNATVNPNGGEVSDCKFEYGTTTEYTSTPVSCASPPGSGTSPVAVSASVTGLSANTTYHFRISATNAGGTSKGSDETLKTPPNAPGVETTAASSITQTTATLNATVNPNGGAVTDCKFEYGTTTEYKSTPVSCASLPGSGTSPVAVSAAVTGLTANTTYHYRVSATNASGTSKGSDQSFTTLGNAPVVVTGSAAAVTASSAILNATVNPNGVEVSECKFEYGTTTEYKSTPVSCASLPGSGTSPVAVSAAVTGLATNTTYHFRISATNAGGTSTGSDQTFKTLTVCSTTATAKLTPLYANGTQIGGPLTSRLLFDEKAGALDCGGGTKVKISGTLKVMGYEAQDLIIARSKHYYLNSFPGGGLLAGEKPPILEWGLTTLTSEPEVTAPITCETAAAGSVENPEGPAGAAPGRGVSSAFRSYNCSSATCPAGEVEIGGIKYEKEQTVTWENLAWPSTLTEAEPGKVRTEIAGVQMSQSCIARGSTEKPEPGDEDKDEPIVLF
jgi:phosphodiesterase/alkaline phosphatase D-like protein